MAAEPINLFSHRQDLAGVAALLRQMTPNVRIIGPDDGWERVTVEGATGWLRRAPTLVFKHDPDYYGGADWPRQVAGMQGYFGAFPDAPRKPDILRLIRSFRFALATEFDPDLFLESNDPRLQFLFAVARHLDGVLFTPSGLWDAEGRALLCADGRSDEEAILPAIAEMPPEPAAGVEETAEDEPIPPDAQRVARRALCLAAVAGRGLLEVESMPREEAEAARERLLTWVGELAMDAELEPEERSALQQPVGGLEPQAAVNAGWRFEGLSVLAWALGRFELPPYDALVDAATLFPAVGFLDRDRAAALAASPALRPPEELRKLQKQCFAIHWRLRNFHLDGQPMNFRQFAQTSWFGPLDVSSARFCEDDLAIGDKPIGRAPKEEFRKALSAAMERHQAINWLVNGGDVYSETDTST